MVITDSENWKGADACFKKKSGVSRGPGAISSELRIPFDGTTFIVNGEIVKFQGSLWIHLFTFFTQDVGHLDPTIH